MGGVPHYDNTTKYTDIEDPAFMDQLEKIKGTAPSSWNWVQQGGVSSVKNQKHATGNRLEPCMTISLNSTLWIVPMDITTMIIADLGEHLAVMELGHLHTLTG